MALSNILLCYCVQLIFHCTIASADPIIGRTEPARVGEFPFIVSLCNLKNEIDKDSHFCGGTLISAKHVLTAAHCIRQKSRNNVMVIVGTIDFRSGERYRVKSWTTYDKWSRSRGCRNNDIAIITLWRDVTDIKPVTISELSVDKVIGQTVVTAGWGIIDEEKNIVPDSLLKATLKVLNDEEYKRNYRELFKKESKPEPNFYYTSANPIAVLSCGDSGGPLLLPNKEIIGVNSYTCDVENPHINEYAMSKHLKLLKEYKQFIEEMKKQ